MKHRTTKLILCTTVLILLLSACGIAPVLGSRTLIRESRAVNGYTGITVSGGGDLVIIQDGTESVSIETDDNLMQYVVAEVKDGTLNLYLDDEGMRSFQPSKLIFTVHVKDLTSVDLSGSWDLSSEKITSDSLDIVVSGSGDVKISELNVGSLDVLISGSGDMEAAGEVDSQEITISGSGTILNGDLRSGTATINISGSGDVTLWVISNLNVEISGSGTVQYYGNPQTNVNTSGSGDLQRLGDK